MTGLNAKNQPRDRQGKWKDAGAGRIPQADDGNDTGREPVTTLMRDLTPLKPQRKGSLHTIKPDDTEIQIQSKLSRYLENNFDGDPQSETLKALEDLYGTHMEPMTVKAGAEWLKRQRAGEGPNVTTGNGRHVGIDGVFDYERGTDHATVTDLRTNSKTEYENPAVALSEAVALY